MAKRKGTQETKIPFDTIRCHVLHIYYRYNIDSSFSVVAKLKFV